MIRKKLKIIKTFHEYFSLNTPHPHIIEVITSMEIANVTDNNINKLEKYVKDRWNLIVVTEEILKKAPQTSANFSTYPNVLKGLNNSDLETELRS